jgi:hypothetical protein
MSVKPWRGDHGHCGMPGRIQLPFSELNKANPVSLKAFQSPANTSVGHPYRNA